MGTTVARKRQAPEKPKPRAGFVAIIGRPNAGKSSLLNQILGRDRAIVSPVPGTTRDTIEETASIGGIPVVFIDTAGLRDAGDEIEIEGVRRSHVALDRAELVLHVLDGAEPHTPRGCPAQAWSVACTLEAWVRLKRIASLSDRTLEQAA